jgi:hypothetical protein
MGILEAYPYRRQSGEVRAFLKPDGPRWLSESHARRRYLVRWIATEQRGAQWAAWWLASPSQRPAAAGREKAV